MKIESCMKRNVISIPLDSSIGEAAWVMVNKHIGILPVVDDCNKPVGVVQMSDLLTLELPDFLDLIKDVDFVHDFGAVETTHPGQDQLSQPVSTVMQSVRTVEERDGLLRGIALMLQNDLYDLPVVDEKGILVGLVSRVDIGSTLLANWPTGVKK
jgi:CBS-domain-containing membrane protein